VVKQSGKFIRLFIKGNRELQSKHKVDVCPHVTVLDPSGKEARVFPKREMLTLTPEEFRRELARVLGEKVEEAPLLKTALGVRRVWRVF